MRRILSHFFLYFIVLLTGMAGLIYQVTWHKYLSRLLGSDTIATAIILAAFLGGLSLGYYLCGKLTLRVKNHLKAYAVLEAIIGCWCLLFPTIFKLVEYSTRSWEFSPPFLIIIQGFFCSVLLMGIPTICMGGTIPFLTRGISRHVTEATHVHARVYAINTAGACLGALVAGFYLIPVQGLPLTMMNTSFLNLAAALYFFLFSTSTSPENIPLSEAQEQEQVATPLRYPVYILYLIAFLSGFYVMTLENVLIRLSGFSLGSSSYTFSLIVAVFIFAIAVGSYLVDRLQNIPKQFLFINQAIITVSLLLVYLTLDTWPYWAHVIRISFQANAVGMIGYYIGVFLVLALVLIVPVSFMGATIPIAFHEIKRDLKNVGKHSGILFSVNTLGSLIGSLIGGFGLYYFFNNPGVFLSAVLCAALSSCLAAFQLQRSYFLSSLGGALFLILFSIYTPFYDENNFLLGTFRRQNLLDISLTGPTNFFKIFHQGRIKKYYDDGPNNTVAVINDGVVSDPQPLSIVVNGKSDSGTRSDLHTLKFLAHLSGLLAEKRTKILVIGLGTGVTAGELTLYPDVERIDIVEISPSVVEALPNFKEFNHDVQHDPRVKIHVGDAFRVLGRSTEKWDIIISEPSNPWVTGVDLLFTKEFYHLAKKHLTENGILLQWTHYYSADEAMMEMMVNTIKSEFEYPRLFLGEIGDLKILATNRDFSSSDLAQSEGVLQGNKRIQDSLKQVNLDSLDAMLIREAWSPAFMDDSFSAQSGLQTMDSPRLHYLAGKAFFMNSSLSAKYFFNETTAAYHDDYLLAKKYRDWSKFAASAESYEQLLRSVKNINIDSYLPMSEGLRMLAHFHNPEKVALTEADMQNHRLDLLAIIQRYPAQEPDWASMGLGNGSYRQKVTALIDVVKQYRSWIFPFPMEGLAQLLQKGLSEGQDAYEKNWCALKLILLLANEKASKEELAQVAGQIQKDGAGNVLLAGEDVELYNRVRQVYATYK